MTELNKLTKITTGDNLVDFIYLGDSLIYSKNFIENGDFDDPLLPNITSTNMEYVTHYEVLNTRTNCLQVNGRTPDTTIAAYYEGIELTIGKSYEFTCWWGGRDVNTYGTLYRPRIQDSNLDYNTAYASQSPNESTIDFVMYVETFVATTSIVRLELRNGKSYGYFDGISLREVPA